MKKQGEILKKLIKDDSRTATEIAALVGISRDTLYKLFPVEKLDEFYTFKFKKIGIDVLNPDKTVRAIDKIIPDNSARPLDTYNIMWVPLVNQRAYAGFLNGYADHEYIEDLPKIPFEVNS